MANQSIYPYGQGGEMPEGYPIADDLNTDSAQVALSAKQGKRLKEMLITYESIDIQDYALSGYTLGIDNDNNKSKWRFANGYSCALIPVSAGDIIRITGHAETARTFYAVLTSNSHAAGETAAYATGYTEQVPIALGGNTVEVVVPGDGKYLYVTINVGGDMAPSQIIMGQEKYTTKEDIAEYAGNQVRFPTFLRCGELTNIIFTMDDFMLAHEYDESQGIDNLKFSNDLGKTWVTKANEFGIIVNAFMFADGTLMIGSKKDDGCRLYWTRDLVTYVFQEATVIDYDGNPYTPVAGTTRFYTPVLPYEHVYIDGDEVYCFWDYIISTANARAWYAISNAEGVTVRAAFAFNLSQIDGVTIPARHVHFFGYNKYNGYYYILTGDHNNTECNIMRGRRNASHVWTWERIVYGQDYKLIMPAFDEGNMYAVTDYTDSYLANSKGVLMVPINEIHKDRFRYLFKATSSFMADGAINGNVGLAWYLVDNHGWRIIKTDYLGNSKILLAHNDHNYVWVDNDAHIRFANMFGPNNNGDVYSRFTEVGNSVSGEAWLKWSHQKTYNFTEIMRNAGATDFFKDWHSLLY